MRSVDSEIEINEALQLLELDDSHVPSKATIAKNYRQLSPLYHSDRGGSDFAMKRLSNAKQLLLLAIDPSCDIEDLEDSENNNFSYNGFLGAEAELFFLTAKNNIHNTITDLKQFLNPPSRGAGFKLLNFIPRAIFLSSIVFVKSLTILLNSAHYLYRTPLAACIRLVLSLLVLFFSFKLIVATTLLSAIPSLLFSPLNKTTKYLFKLDLNNIFGEHIPNILNQIYQIGIYAGMLLRYNTPMFFTIFAIAHIVSNVNSILAAILNHIDHVMMKILAYYLPTKISWPHHVAVGYSNIPVPAINASPKSSATFTPVRFSVVADTQPTTPIPQQQNTASARQLIN